MPAEQPESVVVPREPTEAMTIAGVQAWSDGDDAPPVSTIYRAMVAAAPRQPQGAEAEPVAWERRRTTGSNLGWVPVDPEDIPHYRSVGQDIRALYATPQPVQPAPVGREALAKLVDPNAWDDAQYAEPGGAGQAWSQDHARKAADRILAALSQPAPEAGEVV